jgi:hypothetical protein
LPDDGFIKFDAIELSVLMDNILQSFSRKAKVGHVAAARVRIEH